MLASACSEAVEGEELPGEKCAMYRGSAHSVILVLLSCCFPLAACDDSGSSGETQEHGAGAHQGGADAGGGGAGGGGGEDSISGEALDLVGNAQAGASQHLGAAGSAGAYLCGADEICGNGLDDDCDQQVDEACVCVGGEVQPCYDGRPEHAGNGVCTMGRQACGRDEFSSWEACEGAGSPEPLDCSIEPGTDFDCDGEADSGCNCILGDVRECYDGPDETLDVADCTAGTQTCIPSSRGSDWGDCEGQVLPEIERCDGEDYDCDGIPNTGCDCVIGETRTCYDGGVDTEGVGPCHAGTQTCASQGEGDSSWGRCVDQVVPSVELCDGGDQDCDGETNTDCSCELGTSESCYTGAPETLGVGLCEAGTRICVAVDGGGATWGNCEGEILPSAERCDGTDYDCDGESSPDCVCEVGEHRVCYQGPEETRLIGACRDGEQICVAGATASSSDWNECEGQVVPTTEACDGIDNDCDGLVDEDCGGLECPAEVSVPAGTAVPLVATGTDVIQWAWEILDAPTGGASSAVWSPALLDSATESFQPFIVGDYVIRVTGTVSQSQTLTCVTTVHALPHGLRVELTWDGSGDVDLHLHNASDTPWFSQSAADDDCFYASSTSTWGAVLDTDNTVANGPENVRIDVPELASPYTVGVHNYSAAEGRIATVRVFCGSDAIPKATFVSRALSGTAGGQCTGNEFWKVAAVEFTTLADCDVTPINTYGASNDVCVAF